MSAEPILVLLQLIHEALRKGNSYTCCLLQLITPHGDASDLQRKSILPWLAQQQ